MINEKSLAWGRSKSCIRELAGYASARKAEIGAENVFDFSIGNPSVSAPDCVNETAIRLIKELDPVVLHGYTSAQGDAIVRTKIATSLNNRFSMNLRPENLYITVGAAAALCCCLNGICNPEASDEVIVFAPYFPEYKVFIEKAGGKLVAVPAKAPDFQIYKRGRLRVFRSFVLCR